MAIANLMTRQDNELFEMIRHMSFRDITNSKTLLMNIIKSRRYVFDRWVDEHRDEVIDKDFPFYLDEINYIRLQEDIKEPYYLVEDTYTRYREVGPLHVQITEDDIDPKFWFIRVKNDTDRDYNVSFHDGNVIRVTSKSEVTCNMNRNYMWASMNCNDYYKSFFVIKIEVV